MCIVIVALEISVISISREHMGNQQNMTILTLLHHDGGTSPHTELLGQYFYNSLSVADSVAIY